MRTWGDMGWKNIAVVGIENVDNSAFYFIAFSIRVYVLYSICQRGDPFNCGRAGIAWGQNAEPATTSRLDGCFTNSTAAID